MSVTSPQNPDPRPRSGGIALLVTGSILGLIALAVLALGGAALWGDAKKGRDGYISTASHRVAADNYALASENLDVDLDGAEELVNSGDFGTIRLKVASPSGAPVFVGIARTKQVTAYLRDVAYTTVTDIDLDPFSVQYGITDGRRHPAPPAEQRIWAASAHGSGTQTVRWDVKDGDWSIVVMNADGSSGVLAAVSAAASIPLLTTIAWIAIVVGAFLLVGAGVLILQGMRARRA